MPQIMEIIRWLLFLKRCKQACFLSFPFGDHYICKLYWISLYWLCLVFCTYLWYLKIAITTTTTATKTKSNMINYPMGFASWTRHYLTDRRPIFTREWRQIVFITFFFIACQDTVFYVFDMHDSVIFIMLWTLDGCQNNVLFKHTREEAKKIHKNGNLNVLWKVDGEKSVFEIVYSRWIQL